MTNSKRVPSPFSLTSLLNAILAQINTQTWTIQSLFKALRGKGYPLLLVFLSLPFCQPIQVPGFSTPFGIIIIFIGLRLVFGRRIWWPQWILKHPISIAHLHYLIEKTLWFTQLIKNLLYARWTWICKDLMLLHGLWTILMGLYLTIPIPIPLSNLFPAWSLIFLGLGLIEEDGLFVCISYIIGLIGLIILVGLIFWLQDWIKS